MITNQQYQAKLQSLSEQIEKTQKELDEAEEVLLQIIGKSDLNYDVVGEKERYAKIFDDYLEHLKTITRNASDPYLDTENYINQKNNQIASLSAKRESLKSEIENLDSKVSAKHQKLIQESQDYHAKVQDIFQNLKDLYPKIEGIFMSVKDELKAYIEQLKNESDSIHPHYINLLKEQIAKNINAKQQEIKDLDQNMEELRNKHNSTREHQQDLNQSLSEAETLYNETNEFYQEIRKACDQLEELSKSFEKENQTENDRYRVTVEFIVELKPIVQKIETCVSSFSVISKTLEKASVRIVVKADDKLGRYGVAIPPGIKKFFNLREKIIELVGPWEFSLLALNEDELLKFYNSLKE
ncbi:hypothetical protein GPJ56_005741 [Histomonas meleagridis]|uniref:uncharacterized protein n=1 Tax=Histomonas meleagridis TaxID=135588 RepID=UPI003559E1E7|nr:hypothetical protein GPJ56_005741 [Histomonas meleagridis]KAH0803323.1 hypothetical protein GO595_003667 [Histomonas meleagridis]